MQIPKEMYSYKQKKKNPLKSFRFKEIILHRGGKKLITRKSVSFKIALVYYPEAWNVNGKSTLYPVIRLTN